MSSLMLWISINCFLEMNSIGETLVVCIWLFVSSYKKWHNMALSLSLSLYIYIYIVLSYKKLIYLLLSGALYKIAAKIYIFILS